MNLDVLKTYETTHKSNSDGDNEDITLFTIKKLIATVLSYNDSNYNLAPDSVKMALNTLIKCGIVESDENKNTIQINS